jgi:hypothetical protein
MKLRGYDVAELYVPCAHGRYPMRYDTMYAGMHGRFDPRSIHDLTSKALLMQLCARISFTPTA